MYAYIEQKARLILAGNNHDTKMAKMLLHFTRKILNCQSAHNKQKKGNLEGAPILIIQTITCIGRSNMPCQTISCTEQEDSSRLLEGKAERIGRLCQVRHVCSGRTAQLDTTTAAQQRRTHRNYCDPIPNATHSFHPSFYSLPIPSLGIIAAGATEEKKAKPAVL